MCTCLGEMQFWGANRDSLLPGAYAAVRGCCCACRQLVPVAVTSFSAWPAYLPLPRPYPVLQIAGASLFGIFLSKYETAMCLKLAARLMMWSLPVLVVLTWLTNTLSVGVLGHAKCPQTDFGCLSTGSIHDAENIFTTSIEATKHGWFKYIQQPVLPASLAYVLLLLLVV
ncbi:hypothetical protein ACS0TY_008129 [Phlomoides rotata]